MSGTAVERPATGGRRPGDLRLALVLAAATALALPLLLVLVARGDDVDLGTAAVAAMTAVAVAQALLLAVRRSHPVLCLMAVAVLQAAALPLAPPDVFVRGPAHVVAAYTVGAVLDRRTAGLAIAAAVAVETAAAAALVPGAAALGAMVLNAALVYLASALAGGYVATRRGYVELLRERADRAVREQEDRVRSATVAERTRMARELHDIAAHHLSAMVVQATAAERLVGRDPDAARAAMTAVRRQGRRTLDDLRLLVRVLRDPTAAEDGAPVPGLGRLEELVDEARALGATVTLDRTGDPVALPPLADVTCYRLAQEALTNARVHAPGAAVRVELGYRPGAVRVAVENDAPPAPSAPARPDGVGLVGMRERAQLVGGRLSVGPTPAGGWRAAIEVDADEGRDEERSSS